MTRTAWLAFTPRDTVFVRDGRSFDAAADAFAQTVRPGPTTIAGAVGAAFDGDNPIAVRGPVLARRDGDAWEPYFPVPADLVVTTGRTGRVYRLRPEEAGRTDLDGHSGLDTGAVDSRTRLRMLLPPDYAEPVKPAGGEEPGRLLMPGRVLAEYLCGKLPGEYGTPLQSLQLAEPLLPERRVGLAREGRRARERHLYQSVHLRPADDWAFLAEYTAEKNWDARISHVQFGGKGRLADVAPAAMSWPDATTEVGARVLVYLATPAVWRDGWRMPVPEGARLVAAATWEPEPAATVKPGPEWRSSRVLRWVVPAGSVYLLEFSNMAAGAEWARQCHGTALDRGGHAEEEDLLRTAGFGVVLTGVWT